MTLGQQVSVGPFHFTVIRILVAVGVVRVILRGERLSGGWTTLDRMVLFWGIWAICSSFFHQEVSSALVYRLGTVYNGWGLYFLLRIFIQDASEILAVCKIIIILLVPIALEMLSEAITGKNSFSIFGGVGIHSEVRNGSIRAQGPFAHSILAGTVGGVCMPMAFLFWKKNRLLGLFGLAASGLMVLCSRSSGPILTVIFVLVGVVAWKVRAHMRLLRWSIVCGLFALSLVMSAPVYYLMARVDLTGSSTGYHRAALIESAMARLSEWWLAGTDYTRHWMPTGVGWSEKHTDITNHYLAMGVLGGLPLMMLFIGVITLGFASVGRALQRNRNAPLDEQFTLWTLGAMLFGHAATMLSVSYFDQSIIFLYLVLAAISSATVSVKARIPTATPVTHPTVDRGLVFHVNSLSHSC